MSRQFQNEQKVTVLACQDKVNHGLEGVIYHGVHHFTDHDAQLVCIYKGGEGTDAQCQHDDKTNVTETD